MVPESTGRKTINWALAVVIDAILLMAYVSLSLVAYSGEVDIVTYVRFVLIWLVILLTSLVIFQLPRVFVQYGQMFFQLPPSDTLTLLKQLVLGPSPYPPQKPVLQIQDGQVISEESEVLEQVGGPGFLDIEHNNAVVTSKLGILFRILGPGFHTLEPFEKVWDIVDLRPQRRTINVSFMTSDGIPANVDAEVVYRIPFIDEYIRMKGYGKPRTNSVGQNDGKNPPQTSNFSTDAVLVVTTGKFVNGFQARLPLTDWKTWLPDHLLDNTVRDVLERYTLDAFLYPQYWLSLKEFVNQDGETEYKLVRPQPLDKFRIRIEDQVKALAAEQGIFVEYVELGSVLPVESAISREWLEFWQAKLQSIVYQHSMKVNVDPVQNEERARIGLLVELITGIVQKIQGLAENELEVPPELTWLSFLDVLQTIAEHNPTIQQLANRNVDKLAYIVDIIQRPEAPVDDMRAAPNN